MMFSDRLIAEGAKIRIQMGESRIGSETLPLNWLASRTRDGLINDLRRAREPSAVLCTH